VTYAASPTSMPTSTASASTAVMSMLLMFLLVLVRIYARQLYYMAYLRNDVVQAAAEGSLSECCEQGLCQLNYCRLRMSTWRPSNGRSCTRVVGVTFSITGMLCCFLDFSREPERANDMVLSEPPWLVRHPIPCFQCKNKVVTQQKTQTR
jgi:hypothetical protein